MSEHAAASPAHSKSGDMVLLDYELWSESGGKNELIDTSRADVAQKENFSLPAGYEFGPRPHIVGGDDFPAALETAIATAPLNQEVEKELTPAEAFGERDPKLIELFSMHEIERLPEMRREDADLAIGTVLTIRGRRGRVVSYTAARVRVDFNPPFAGRKIRAKFKVVGPITEPEAKARALVDLTYGRGKDFEVEMHEKVLTVTLPDRAKFDLAWHAATKSRLIERLRSHVHPKSIRFLEEYVTPTPKETKTAEVKAEKKAEEAPEAPGAEAAAEKRPPAKAPHGGSPAAAKS
jgi:FKBP-type peptidyl-prolyl cis-trans isomerase SlyD